MVIASKPLNKQAIILEEAETKIREVVRDDYLKQVNRETTTKKVKRVIESALKQITITSL